jgi:hypothetical protein
VRHLSAVEPHRARRAWHGERHHAVQRRQAAGIDRHDSGARRTVVGYTYRIIGRPRDTSVTLRDINIVPAPGAQRADRQRDVSGGGDRPQEHGHLHRFDYMLDK